MTLNKLIFPPDQNGYSFLDGQETLSVKLDGGASKFRRDILDANSNLNVQWTCNSDIYQYLRVFYKVFTLSGSLPFLIDLYYDDPVTLTECEVHFIPGTFGLKSQKGETFVVGATLEVVPPDISQNTIDTMSLYALFGDQWSYYESLFDTLINVSIPADYP